MTNKISSASQTVRAFNVGTLGDCSAWDDNLGAAPLEWLPAEEAPSFMSGTGSDEVCESGIGFAREREGCCMCSFGNDELDSDKQSFWVQNGIGRRFLSPDVFSDGLYTGGESFWSRLSGSSAQWLRKFGFYKK